MSRTLLQTQANKLDEELHSVVVITENMLTTFPSQKYYLEQIIVNLEFARGLARSYMHAEDLARTV